MSFRRRSFALAARQLLFIVCVLLAAPAALATPTAEEAENATATREYLAAAYEYEQTVVGDLGASKAAVEQLATRVGGECAGVLGRAPREGAPGASSARKWGEKMRLNEQVEDLEEELTRAVEITLRSPYREAAAAYVAKLRALRWGSPSVAEYLSQSADAFEERFREPIPDACADMRAWAASGYRTLPPATKALVREREARMKRPPAPPEGALRLLHSYEERFDKPVRTEIDALVSEARVALRALSGPLEEMMREVGVTSFHGGTHPQGPPAGSVVFAGGRTAAGERYRARLEKNLREPRAPNGTHTCPLSIVVLDSEGEPTGACVSVGPRPAAYQSVSCNEGLLQIRAITVPAARRVRLRLSEGKRITSTVLRVPARLGGGPRDDGLYFQIVRGPKPIPLALVELGAKGRTLKVLKLPRIVECTKKPLKFLHHGIRTLAHGRTPAGHGFTIKGEAYRFLGAIHFALQVGIEGEGGGGESSRGARPKLLQFATWTGCEPAPYAIVYGVLHDRGDVVLARTTSGLVPLKQAPIPPHLHAHGILVYGATSPAPSALIVRRRDGRTVLVEDLGKLPRETRERCEGEAEGG